MDQLWNGEINFSRFVGILNEKVNQFNTSTTTVYDNNSRQSTYEITLECIETKEIDISIVFLSEDDYNKITENMDEVVYTEGKEWVLKKIKKI